ncbi:MAG: glycerophosphodiester phosphodiesterase [Muribaculaceae bacterium]|nr:glycerophosphodiester phosphodiesterase [Muribaculaceae bacterium]
MKLITRILVAAAVLFSSPMLTACGDDEPQTPGQTETEQPGNDNDNENGEEPGGDDNTPGGEEPGGDEPVNPGPDTPSVPVPAAADNIVVAHRGGSKEAGADVPDNSIASLSYAMDLGCYASECDIYITGDGYVIVAHADANGRINGYYPCEATLRQIREAAPLSNGEQIPTLQEYLAHAMTEGSCTRLWLDIKNVTSPSAMPEQSIAACRTACVIVSDMKAQPWVEFICTSNETVMNACAPLAREYGIEIGWMANRPASEYTQFGYGWANMSVSNMTDATHSGPRTVDEFTSAGVKLSVYNVDKAKNMRYYIQRIDQMKAICTNNPALLLKEMGLRQ